MRSAKGRFCRCGEPNQLPYHRAAGDFAPAHSGIKLDVVEVNQRAAKAPMSWLASSTSAVCGCTLA